jgi:hypothetical protein
MEIKDKREMEIKETCLISAKDSECGICHELPTDAVETRLCGHIFCHPCANRLGPDTRCPTCREPSVSFRAAIFLRRFIANQTVLGCCVFFLIVSRFNARGMGAHGLDDTQTCGVIALASANSDINNAKGADPALFSRSWPCTRQKNVPNAKRRANFASATTLQD